MTVAPRKLKKQPVFFLAVLILLAVSLGILAAAWIFRGPAAAQSSADWPQLQYGPKRTGHNPQSLTGPFQEKWSVDLGVAMADRIQPVISNGVVIVGDVDGTIHALREANGEALWTYQTGGAILYSAAFEGDQVIAGSHDGNLYALNAADGSLHWQAPVPKGAGGAPLVADGTVYVGGKNGSFYAFDSSDGSLRWRFDPASQVPGVLRAPILSSAAIHPQQDLVYFADENVRAYALEAGSGELRWSQQMYGESAYDSWPVVSESLDVVMFRTKSVYGFQASLIHDENDLFCPGNSSGECNSCTNLNPSDFDSPAEETLANGSTSTQWNEQHFVDGDNQIESIDEIFQIYPQRLTFFAFDPQTGDQKWSRPAPVLWTGGGGRLGIMPVVNDTSGDVYTFWRTQWSRHDLPFFCRRWVDVGRLVVRDNLPTLDFLACPQGLGSGCRDGDDFHFIGDETTVLSLAGDLLLMTGWYNTGGLYVDDVNCPGTACEGNSEFVVGSGYGLPQGGAGTGGDSAAPASVANRTIFVKHHAGFPSQNAEPAPYTILAAYQGQ